VNQVTQIIGCAAEQEQGEWRMSGAWTLPFSGGAGGRRDLASFLHSRIRLYII